MANEEQLAILRQGVEVWNQWRKDHHQIHVDLREIILAGVDLAGVDLERANLARANLARANLAGAMLEDAVFYDANLDGANLHDTWLQRVNFLKAHLNGAKLDRAYLHGADLEETNLQEASLQMANLKAANLTYVNLVGANLQGANLEGASLIWANLQGANLEGASLMSANLQGANLEGASLISASLHQAILHSAVLKATNLQGAILAQAKLEWTELEQANLTRAHIGATVFASLDLRNVIGLDTVSHSEPSTVGIDTLYRSAGHIPESFLRGCGVPDALIEYLPSLIGAMQPVQYYSCFISYSSIDEIFTRRLYDRMRGDHLRVWFAPEELKGGERLFDQIDQAIRVYDKTILVLSEASMNSLWVQTELRRARAQERRGGKRKLFPIRVVPMEQLQDWTLFDADAGTDLAAEVRSYFIPDFSNWKDHDAFEEAYARLLRDLKAAA